MRPVGEPARARIGPNAQARFSVHELLAFSPWRAAMAAIRVSCVISAVPIGSFWMIGGWSPSTPQPRRPWPTGGQQPKDCSKGSDLSNTVLS